jgi:hypothetical protein
MRSIPYFIAGLQKSQAYCLSVLGGCFAWAIWGEDSGEDKLMAQAGGVLKAISSPEVK